MLSDGGITSNSLNKLLKFKYTLTLSSCPNHLNHKYVHATVN